MIEDVPLRASTGVKKPGHGSPPSYSMVETCRRQNLAIRDYLASVLPGLEELPITRIAECTSSAWAAARTRPLILCQLCG